VIPASTFSSVPVTYRASSESRYTTAWLTSTASTRATGSVGEQRQQMGAGSVDEFDHPGRVDAGEDAGGMNDVDSNAVNCQFVGQRLRQPDDAELGCHVG
jgi:hypothetical protein